MRPEPRPEPGPAPLHDGRWMNPVGGPLIRVATGCASIDEFVDRFAKFASEGTLVLPASARLTVGTEGRFAIVLRDRSVAMHGRCRVTAAAPAALSASRPGVHRTMLRLALLDIDETTRAVHARLLMARRPPASQPAPSPPAPPRSFEARAPRAPLTLPANPFSQLGADDLASFVECTLFEANPEVEETVADRRAPEAHRPSPIPVVVARSPIADPAPATPSERAPAPPPAGPAITATRIALCAACVIAGVAVGLNVRAPAVAPTRRGDSDLRVQVAPETRAPAPLAPLATRAPAPSAPPLVEAIVPPAEGPSAAKDSPAPTAVGGCSVHVVTEPGHAEVLWNGAILGRSPLEEAPVACGTATVTIRREHFQPVTREITTEPGSPTSVTQELQRRTGTLIVGSSPPGAEITVNGRALGPAPARLEVPRYETVEIKATLPGHLPWTKSLYVSQPETRVGMKLRPVAHDDVARGPVGEADTDDGDGADQP